MIVQLFINAVIDILNTAVGWLPVVTSLPTVNGFDFDTALSTGVGSMRSFFGTFWPLAIIFEGFMVLVIYYGAMLVIKIILGSRTPTH